MTKNHFIKFRKVEPLIFLEDLELNTLKNTVGYQRKKLLEIFVEKINFNKVSKKKYMEDLRKSVITLSPFGNGELCFRDFEAFMSGAILLKPDISYLDTWPNFYIKNSAYVPFSWELNDISEITHKILSNKDKYQIIAINGQNNYKKFTISDEATYLFYQNLSKLIYNCG